MNEEWIIDRMLEGAKIMAAHDERLNALEDDLNKREDHVRELQAERLRQRPSWINLLIAAIAVVISAIAIFKPH